MKKILLFSVVYCYMIALWASSPDQTACQDKLSEQCIPYASFKKNQVCSLIPLTSESTKSGVVPDTFITQYVEKFGIYLMLGVLLIVVIGFSFCNLLHLEYLSGRL